MPSNQAAFGASTAELPQESAAGLILSIVAGDNQVARLAMTEHGFPMATFDPVAALLTDEAGKPLPGRPVAWSVGETTGTMGVQLDPMGTAPIVVLTDEQGIATLDRMRGRAASAFYDYGPFTLVARHGNASAAAALLVAKPVALALSVAAGDNQCVPRGPGGDAVFAPVRILVKDAEGNIAAGVPLTFEAVLPRGMTIRLDADGSSMTDVTSDAEGFATLDLVGGAGMVCRGCDGDFKVKIQAKDTKPIYSHHTVGTPA